MPLGAGGGSVLGFAKPSGTWLTGYFNTKAHYGTTGYVAKTTTPLGKCGSQSMMPARK